MKESKRVELSDSCFVRDYNLAGLLSKIVRMSFLENVVVPPQRVVVERSLAGSGTSYFLIR